MSPMTRPWLHAFGAVALFAAGCGARTGLADDGPPADGGVDPGDAAFPCTYAPIGELVPIAPSLVRTMGPDLAWGGGRLGATFAAGDEERGPTARACTTSGDAGWACDDPLEMGALGGGTVHVAWDVEAFGACWLERSDARVSRFQRIAPDGRPLWDAPADLVGAAGPCRDLVRASDRYVVALASNVGDLESSTAVLTLDLLGTVQDELLVVPPHLDDLAPLALAADGELAAAAWVDGDGLHLRTLAGPIDSEIAFNVWPSNRHLRLAVHGTEAGLLWAVEGDTRSRLFLTRADLATGGAGEPVEVAHMTAGGFSGVDLVAVPEGFLIAYNSVEELTMHTVVVPTRRGEGFGVDVRREIELFSGDMREPFDPGAPALAYDELDAYVATTVAREDDGVPEVRTQVLACHR